VDAPTRPGAHVLVVVAQMPYQVAGLAVGDGPVVRDAGDATEGVVAIVARGVHLADDRVLGSGDGGQRGHRAAHAVASVVLPHRLQ
jgi:hypothetical protein